MKKILLLFVFFNTLSISQNWFPLHLGNTWDYFMNTRIIGSFTSPGSDYSEIWRVKVVDTLTVNGKLYYKLVLYPYYPAYTLFRYDQDIKKVFINQYNYDYLYMDFNKVGGDIFSQYAYNNNWRNVMVFEDFVDFNNQLLYTKGYTFNYLTKSSYHYFIDNIGFLKLTENTSTWGLTFYNGQLVEYLLFDSVGNSSYFKHNLKPQILYNQCYYLPDVPLLKDTFEIKHNLNNYGLVGGGFVWNYIYIDSVFIQYYYSNGSDTTNLTNLILPIILQPWKLKSVINLTIDTTLYQSGYHLYYRIGVKDKGIIPSYFYLPDTGYIKLYWRDSTSSVDSEELPLKNFHLYQNHPNPFNPGTTISWQTPVSGWQTIKLFDLLGREIDTIVDGFYEAGSHSTLYIVNSTLPSGVYFYQLRVSNPSNAGESFVQTRKMILLR